ncbi:hypothetical protein NQD34_009233 [Periophthalmus magnuspinnatus]|nr:hypothetical protein NQD34_009233 [Periophthalmus magnuspinnatus]
MGRFVPGSVAPRVPLLALVLWVTTTRTARVLPGASDNCTQQGLSCSVHYSNCLDPDWVLSHSFTPPRPETLDLRISTRSDPKGNLLPVMSATWRLRDDGGISFLKASELHVVVVSTNQNLCVRYTYNTTLPMRDPRGDKWSWSSDVVVVDPGQSYSVSVENIPKAELDHSTSSVSKNITVPGCSDPVMRRTLPCVQSGILWSPNISWSESGSVLTVEFSPDPLSDKYKVLCLCGRTEIAKTTLRAPAGNVSRLNVSFPFDTWSCCRLRVEVLSYFPHCKNDCRRHSRYYDLCKTDTATEPPDKPRPLPVALGASALVLLLVGVCIAGVVCGRRGRTAVQQTEKQGPFQTRLEEHPTLLLIYSRDHPLYLDVVLKLAAFLQAQCGILVLLDLLDSSSVSQFGVVRWLELQRQKLGPNDKILVLCSHGVQSKWRAMCGQGQVEHQPDDLIGPFLSLFLSDMHIPHSRGRYIAAFFEDFGSERDVPSFFDIVVKYKLMKHFEELYFRVLDREKYEPQRVNHIQGIGPDEFHRCGSGRALQNAIHTFAAFQIHNPDWFENAGTEVVSESSLLLETMPLPQILEYQPIVRDPDPIYTNDILANETTGHFYIDEPEVKRDVPISLNEPLLPALTPDQSVLEVRPEPRPNMDIFKSELIPNAAMQIPVEDEDETESGAESGVSAGQSAEWAESGDRAGQSAEWAESGVSAGQSVEEELQEGEESKGQSSASDQGYSSRAWTEPNSDHMRALLRLQQELMSGFCHFENE